MQNTIVQCISRNIPRAIRNQLILSTAQYPCRFVTHLKKWSTSVFLGIDIGISASRHGGATTTPVMKKITIAHLVRAEKHSECRYVPRQAISISTRNTSRADVCAAAVTPPGIVLHGWPQQHITFQIMTRSCSILSFFASVGFKWNSRNIS